jgi:hypothetical protein
MCRNTGAIRFPGRPDAPPSPGEELGHYEILVQIGAPDDTRIEALVVTLVSVKTKWSIYVTFLLNLLRRAAAVRTQRQITWVAGGGVGIFRKAP